MAKIDMPDLTKPLISLAFLNARLFCKAKTTYFSNMLFRNSLVFNNLLWDSCGVVWRLRLPEIKRLVV
jgi:hypothetical protein